MGVMHATRVMYTVGANGICQSTAAEQSGYVTITKIQVWNPSLNALCTNMKRQDGMQISVRYVGETKELTPQQLNSISAHHVRVWMTQRYPQHPIRQTIQQSHQRKSTELEQKQTSTYSLQAPAQQPCKQHQHSLRQILC